MPNIGEGNLIFRFPDDWLACRPDKWAYHRNSFQSICGGAKAVDILAITPRHCLWLVEVKDYREHRRTKTIELADEVARKVRDSLAALLCAHMSPDEEEEKTFAGSALASASLRVALHLEQPRKRSKLFPRAIDPASVKQKLRQLIRPVDSHPLVIEIGRMQNVEWEATSRNP